MDNIKIYDNFLTSEELKTCTLTISRPAWSFGQISQTSLISTPFWIMDLADDAFFNTHLKSRIETVSGRKFEVKRIYANGQTFGQDGTFHQDDESQNSYTFCIYVNKQITAETADDVGGEFIFKVPNQAHSTHIETARDVEIRNPFSRIAVAPLYNRGILFPANYFHKGLSFNRYSKSMRVSIAWKLTEYI
jgi:hypothetical protein